MLAMAAAGLLLSTAPVAGQNGNAVWYDGVGFAFGTSLGKSVNIVQVRAVEESSDRDGDPAHLSFTLYGARDDGQRSPAIGWVPGAAREIRVYQVSDLTGDTASDAQLEALQRLLADRPDPATLSTAGGVVIEGLPWMPPVSEAARIVQARIQYIDTPEVAGVASIASWAQDTIPPTSDDLLWTFQGLSADGATYVSIIWSLRTDALPAKLPNDLFDDLDRRWPTILGQASTTIEDAAPSAFTPSLDTLDALVQSMVLPGGPSSQAPEASPAT